MHDPTLNISKPVMPARLSAHEKEAFTEELYQLHSQIFDGVSRSQFVRYVIDPSTEVTKIFVFRNAAGTAVGYLTFQVFLTQIRQGRRMARRFVVRTETGLLPAYRGHAPISRILLRESIRFWIRKGFPKGYFLATPISPIPYAVMNRSVHRMYPRPGQPVPVDVQQVMDSLSDALALEAPAGAADGVKKVGWIVKMDAAQRSRLLAATAADIRFYLRRNPGFEVGNGMLTVIPGGWYNLMMTGMRVLRRAFARRARC